MTLADLQALERAHVIPSYARLPVEFVRGAGCSLWDSEGNEYLDVLAGISVSNTGHCHPAVVAAVQEQAARLMHVTNLFYTEPGMRLAQRLSESSLGGKVFFCNSGAEAVEAALKLARKARPRGEIVVQRGAFHGRTMGALSATPQEAKQAPFAPLVPGFVVIERDDPAALAAAVGDQTAAVLLEPVLGEGGVYPVPDDVLLAARDACDRTGAALIFDEIQSGMGRTGTLWAYEQAGVVPDAMTTAKGLGGGLPIGALVTGPRLADTLQPGDHGSTFAGGPVAAAAANAVFDVIDRPEFLQEVRTKGAHLAQALEDLPAVTARRGRGLMHAIDVEADAPAAVLRALTEERLVANATGPHTIRFLPPLTISHEQIDDAAARMRRVLQDA
ncbi:MAG: acetylornithine/succinylornithine family transaminase [Solirubrobacteraceae bacterium]